MSLLLSAHILTCLQAEFIRSLQNQHRTCGRNIRFHLGWLITELAIATFRIPSTTAQYTKNTMHNTTSVLRHASITCFRWPVEKTQWQRYRPLLFKCYKSVNSIPKLCPSQLWPVIIQLDRYFKMECWKHVGILLSFQNAFSMCKPFLHLSLPEILSITPKPFKLFLFQWIFWIWTHNTM